VNRTLDSDTATEIAKLFVEAIIAPGYAQSALEILGGKKNLRVIETDMNDDPQDWARFELKRISGGVLLQTTDNQLTGTDVRLATKREPTEVERADLDFAWR